MTDAVRACLYVVMAIFSAVTPRLCCSSLFSVLLLGQVTYHSSYGISVHVGSYVFGPSVLLFSWGIAIVDVGATITPGVRPLCDN